MIDGFVLRKEEFGGLLANLKTGKIYKLNKEGVKIIQFLKENDTEDKFIKRINSKFETNKKLIQFIKFLKTEKIIL